MKKLYDKKILLMIISGIVLLIMSLIFYLKNEDIDSDTELSLVSTTTISSSIKEKNYIDIKGSVKNPGVYEFEENDRVIDAIEKAGGLKKNANTNNINLSKKLTSEMVIYVYSNSEIKNGNNALTCNTVCDTEVIEINNCVEKSNNNSETVDLININTATLEELQTLTGIGESKAKNIIEYRNTNGSFKSIEDIKNISGIGDSLFEKIKDKITI